MTIKETVTQVQKALGIKATGTPGTDTWAAVYKRIFKASATLTTNITIIKAIQTKLGVGADGKAGTGTWQAIYNAVLPVKAVKPAKAAAANTGKVDPRSEKTIATLQPEIQGLARSLVQKAAAAGITIKIISGLRTYAEQDALYAQGRTKPGKKVTNAKGGYSNHNFGLAFDVGVFKGTAYMPESPDYAKIAPLGKSLGLAWGGDWKNPKDLPHYELRPPWAKNMNEPDMLAGLRKRKAEGKSLMV
jgi:peptidoglycan LD-endopeptidase CwlK